MVETLDGLADELREALELCEELDVSYRLHGKIQEILTSLENEAGLGYWDKNNIKVVYQCKMCGTKNDVQFGTNVQCLKCYKRPSLDTTNYLTLQSTTKEW